MLILTYHFSLVVVYTDDDCVDGDLYVIGELDSDTSVAISTSIRHAVVYPERHAGEVLYHIECPALQKFARPGMTMSYRTELESDFTDVPCAMNGMKKRK